jgi:hypothetical protein
MRVIRLTVVLALGLTLAPLAAEAQQGGKISLVGVLRPASPTDPLTEAFRQGLRDLFYTLRGALDDPASERLDRATRDVARCSRRATPG